MSNLGPVVFGRRQTIPFLGFEEETEKNYSEKVAVKIDKEGEKIIKEAEQRANKLLREKKKLLQKIAKVLMEKETIEKEEFEHLIKTINKRITKSKRGKTRIRKEA